ncbi:hypothetical protein JKF63_06462 [Porcisia hertigi]|uniref:Uncharacterized protein n=1 Tax=Porcisia hertigi TaxID=2761500 RepID=A0A836YIF4_9TRYP|nr:hypothetical protein JKF63_06462 [Porcisia hertigi]
MASDSAALRAHCTGLFDTAMPPIVNGSASSPFSIGSLSAIRLDRLSSTVGAPLGGVMRWSHAPLATAVSDRSVEAALLRREQELRNEYYRLCAEDQWKMRQQREAKRHQDDEEERQRTMELARKIEEERARRVAEQQEHLIRKERELEEWRLERIKEADAARRLQQQEDERRLELQHERELARIKEAAASRAASAQKSEDVRAAIEESLEKMRGSMQQQLRDEVRALEAVHESQLARREAEWVQRVEAMEVSRSTELADLTHQLQLDQARATRSEEQLREARDQLTKLLQDVSQLRLLLQSGGPCSERHREADQHLAATHRSAIERLQQMYDDDMKAQQRRYAEDRDRAKYEQERYLRELKDGHTAAVRVKDQEIDELRNRVRQLERELQDESTKLVLLRAGEEQLDSMGVENARIKDELRQLQASRAELEEAKRRLERSLHEADARADAQSKQLQALQSETVSGQRQLVAERDDLRRDNVDLKRQLAMMREGHEEELARLQQRLKSAEEVAAQVNVREMEKSARNAVNDAEEARRRAENDLAQATRKLKVAEEEIQSLKRSTEAAQRDVAQARDRIQELQAKLEERTAKVRALEMDVQDKVGLAYEAREAKERVERLQAEYGAERESRRRQHEAALEAKDREVQQCRAEVLEITKKLHALREECANTKFDKEGHHQRLSRQLAEREEEVAQLRGQLGDSRQALEQWKAMHEELQQRSGTSTDGYQKAVLEREAELQECRRRLSQLQDEKAELGRRLRTAEEAARISTAQGNDVQREVQELRAQPAPLSTPRVSVSSSVSLPGPPPPPPPSAAKTAPLFSASSIGAPPVAVEASSASNPGLPVIMPSLSEPNRLLATVTPPSPGFLRIPPPPPPPGAALASPSVTAGRLPVPTASHPAMASPQPAAAGVHTFQSDPLKLLSPTKVHAVAVQSSNSVDFGTTSVDGTTEGTPLSIPVPRSLSQSAFQVGRQSNDDPSLSIVVPTPAGALSLTTSAAPGATALTPVIISPRTPHGSHSAMPSVSVPSVPVPQVAPVSSVTNTGVTTSSIPSPAAPPPPPPVSSVAGAGPSSVAGVARVVPVPVPVPVPAPVSSLYSAVPVPGVGMPSVPAPTTTTTGTSTSPSAGVYGIPPPPQPIAVPLAVPSLMGTSPSVVPDGKHKERRHSHRSSHHHHHRS